MNKYAAEKIAHLYYQVGVELALVKEAGLPKEIIKKMVQVPAAGVAAVGALPEVESMVWDLMQHSKVPEEAARLLGLSGIGGAAMLSAAGAGKAVDLAHLGGSKLLNKLRR